MTFWEYRIEQIADGESLSDFTDRLNRLGADGWEYVGANLYTTPGPAGPAPTDYGYVFKRPKPGS
jgi:hypothetical protein